MAKLQKEKIDGVTVIHLSGSLTQEGLAEVETQFQAATAGKGLRIVVDVEKVNALTTPAITMFLTTLRAAQQGDGKVAFCGAKNITADIFTRCRLDAIFTICKSVEEAVAYAKA